MQGGNLDCLKYAHECGCTWNTDTTAYAAQRGSLDCLKYLHENKCDWDDGACACAAVGGHLECLKYLHENGCPMMGEEKMLHQATGLSLEWLHGSNEGKIHVSKILGMCMRMGVPWCVKKKCCIKA